MQAKYQSRRRIIGRGSQYQRIAGRAVRRRVTAVGCRSRGSRAAAGKSQHHRAGQCQREQSFRIFHGKCSFFFELPQTFLRRKMAFGLGLGQYRIIEQERFASKLCGVALELVFHSRSAPDTHSALCRLRSDAAVFLYQTSFYSTLDRKSRRRGDSGCVKNSCGGFSSII